MAAPRLQRLERLVGALVAKDYDDNMAEAHRRRPTLFPGPMATAHISFHHPNAFVANFRPYLTVLLTFLMDTDTAPPRRRIFHPADAADKTPRQIARKLADVFSFDKNSENESLTYEFADLRFTGNGEDALVRWRLEVHREYVSITLYAHLSFDTLGDGSTRVRALIARGGQSAGVDETVLSGARFSGMMSRALFKTLDARLQAEFTTLLAKLAVWTAWAEATLPRRLKIMRQPPRSRLEPPQIFARFGGAVVPWTVYAPALKGDDDQPYFPRFRDRGILRSAAKPDEAMACTDRFLVAIYPGLKSHLLNRSRDECVACYLQKGHALYISNLGARRSSLDNSPARYLVLYDDPDRGGKGNSHPKNSQEAKGNVWRLGRVVGRLHELGVSRLAALRRQVRLKDFAQSLRSVEFQIQALDETVAEELKKRKAASDIWSEAIKQRVENDVEEDQIGSLRAKIDAKAKLVGEPIAYRSGRTAHHLGVIKNLIDDLGVVPIPGWLSYDKFFRRRLLPTLEYLSSIGVRLQRVLDRIESRQAALTARRQRLATDVALEQADKIIRIQRVADFFVKILALYYVPLTCAYLIKSLAAAYLGIFEQVMSPFSWRLTQDSHATEDWFYLAFAVSFIGTYFIVGRDIVREAYRDKAPFAPKPKATADGKPAEPHRHIFRAIVALLFLLHFIVLCLELLWKTVVKPWWQRQRASFRPPCGRA